MSSTMGFGVAGSRFGEFTVTSLLHQSERSLVLRCQRADGRPAVVKFLRTEPLGAGDVARFRREYELSRRIVHPGVVAADALGSREGVLYMAMPDDGAQALRDRLRAGPLPVAEALRIALAVVDALEAVHALNVVHKDISPGNIICVPDGGAVKLIDFGIAAEISSERPELARPEDLEGTLAYMAPEQSGRMNRDVDYRADFYGLGAMLYELLCGAPPFAFADPVQAVHAHLALAPRRLAERGATVPPVLGRLVAKLLAKEPEARYQSHFALRRDLARIQAGLDDVAALAAYRLAEGDLPERFQVSGRLYGRAEPVRRMVEAFEAVAAPADGAARVVTIAGTSGIGKTALVQEVQRSLLGHRGHFVAGKFNQFGQHVPYAAFTQALQQRGRQVLALPAEAQARWRDRLLAVLGANAVLAADAVPDLARLLGALPPVVALGPTEAENRFLRTLQLAFAALADEREPLVLFVDDLQWADRASRRLLRELAHDDGLHHVLVIGAYRANEVPPDHPLAADLASLAELGQRAVALDVGPLTEGDVTQLLADTLHRAPSEVQALAALCQAKTGGNPFFLRRFLEDIHHRGLIRLDRRQARWDWSVERIAAEGIADNVVALMLEQLRRLPPATLPLLTAAACLGVRFELCTLATATGEPEAALLQALTPALEATLLVPSDGRYKWVAVLDEVERAGLRVGFAFAHDRVQEAAYKLARPEDRPGLHLRIGRLLRTGMDTRRPAFDVVNHLNLGCALMDDAAERQALAGCNARASELARDAAAFDLAAHYADQAIALYGPGHAQQDPALALGLHVHAARMAYLSGDEDRMNALVDAAMAWARGPLEQARLLDVRIESFYATGRLGDTLETGLQALALLGGALPEAATPEQAVRLVAEARAEIEALGLDALAARAPMDDPLCLQQIAVTAKMTAAAYIARPALLPLLTVLQLRLMMRHGHAPGALSAYSVMGLMVAEFLGDYRFGYALGRLSLDLIERHGWRQVAAHSGFSFNAFLCHWIEPVENGLPGLLAVNDNGQEFGNLRHAGLALYVHGYHAFLAGQPLAELQAQLDVHAATLRRIRQRVAQDYLAVLQAAVAELQADLPPAEPLESPQFSAARLAGIYEARSDQTGLMFLHAFRCLLHALAGRHAQAVASGEAAAQLFPAARGMFMVPYCLFFTASSALALGVAEAGEARAARRATAAAALVRFERWAPTSVDLAPLALLLRARLALFDGGTAAAPARAALDEALALAEARGNLLLLGLVRRCRATLLAEQGLAGAEAVGIELAEARTLFLRWGARALAAPLPKALAQTASRGLGDGTAVGLASSALDLATLMKAAQAVAADIEFGPLLQRMVHVLQENAGASRSAIVLRDDANGWILQADSAGAEAAGGARVLLRGPLEQAGDALPLEMLRTVLNTGSTVLVHDLAQEPGWQRLAYFERREARSVLCMPLLRQGRVVGALYLENDGLSHAFSPQRTEFLELLSGNVVNAIDNARLYGQLRELADTLEQRVAQRTQELRASEARTQAILRNAPMPMSVTRRADGVLVYANEHAAAMTGFTSATIVGQKAQSRYRDPADRERMYATYLADGVLRDHETCLLAKDGREVWTLISMVPIDYDGEACDLATIVDITERKAMEEALRRLATTDALTGAFNRGHFLQRAEAELERARRYGRPLSVIMLDIDHFKQINDRYGHAVGDAAIRVVTAACGRLVRQQDFMGRLGGEEFGIVMPETERQAAEVLAGRLRQEVASLELDGVQGPLTASFGVAELQPGDTLDSLLARADGGLYQAKRAGRNRVECV